MLQASATLPLTPPSAVVAMLVVFEPPCATLIEAGVAPSVKSRGSTMISTCCARTSVPLVPWMLNRLEPPGVEAVVVKVSVECAPASVGVTAVGEKPHDAPVGSPVQASVTEEAKPLAVVSATS